MVDVELSFESKQKLTRQLDALPKNLRRKILREEARGIAKDVLLPRLKEALPVRKGKLRKAARVRAIKKSRVSVGVRLALSSAPFKGDTFYGGFLEWGWKPGKRSRQLQAAQQLISRRKRSPLKSKTTRRRSLQAEHSSARALSSDRRSKVPGKGYMKSVADKYGNKAATEFANRVSRRIDEAAS